MFHGFNTTFWKHRQLVLLSLGRSLHGIAYGMPKLYLLSSSKHLMDNIVIETLKFSCLLLQNHYSRNTYGVERKGHFTQDAGSLGGGWTNVQRPPLKLQTKQKGFKAETAGATHCSVLSQHAVNRFLDHETCQAAGFLL